MVNSIKGVDSADHFRGSTQNNLEKFKDFASNVQKYSDFIQNATQHFGTQSIKERISLASTGIFEDQATPLYAPLLALITREQRPEFKIPMPPVFLLRNSMINRTDKRREFYEEAAASPSSFNLTGIRYVLTRYNKIIAEMVDNNIIIHNQEQFDRCISPRSKESSCLIQITEEIIDEVIAEGVIPESSRSLLMKHVGKLLWNVLMHEAKIWGDLSRAKEIQTEELDPIDLKDVRSAINFAITGGRYSGVAPRRWSPNPSQDIRRNGHNVHPEIINIWKYLKGEKRLEDLHLNKSNAHWHLGVLKLIDWETELSNCLSYGTIAYDTERDAALRTRIIKLIPQIRSHEAFLRTVNQHKAGDPRHWLLPGSFTTECAALHARVLVIEFVAADTLSRSGRLPGLVGIRGTSGVGKSTYIKNYVVSNYAGVMNPDNLKWLIKHDPVGLGEIFLNSQVHELGKALYGQLLEQLKEDPNFLYVLDERLLTPELILSKLITPAERKGCMVYLPDLECSSIICPMLRMLLRDPMGPDPTPTTEVLIRGCIESIQNRSQVIKLVKSQELVWEYKLILDGNLVAEKNGQIWTIYDEDAYRQCTEFTPEVKDRIIRETETVVDDRLLDNAVRMKYVRSSERERLASWKGFTLAEAVDKNAMGLN